MLQRIDAADPLVRAVESKGGIGAGEAANLLLALAGPVSPAALAVVDRVVADDARLVWRGGKIALAPSPLAGVPLEQARFCVVDVETTGLVPGRERISELAAVVVEAGEVLDELEVVGRAATAPSTFSRLSELARGAAIAGHNVRFDLAFLERVTATASGTRIASPSVDTLTLARRLLAGRLRRFSLGALAEFVGTGSVPCHRALPDARAAAEILGCLVVVARERGARTMGDLCALARPARRSSN